MPSNPCDQASGRISPLLAVVGEQIDPESRAVLDTKGIPVADRGAEGPDRGEEATRSAVRRALLERYGAFGRPPQSDSGSLLSPPPTREASPAGDRTGAESEVLPVYERFPSHVDPAVFEGYLDWLQHGTNEDRGI